MPFIWLENASLNFLNPQSINLLRPIFKLAFTSLQTVRVMEICANKICRLLLIISQQSTHAAECFVYMMATKRTKRGVKRNVEQVGKSNSFDWQDKQIIGISCRINVKIWHNTSYMAVKVELTEHFISGCSGAHVDELTQRERKSEYHVTREFEGCFFHFQLELYKALWFITCLFSLWAHWKGGKRVLLLLVFI